MHRRTTPFFAVAGTAGAALACLLAFRAIGTPAAWMSGLLRDPFRLQSAAVPAGPVVLERIQQLQRLETCRYNGQVVVKGDTHGLLPNWLAGDRMLFMGYGEVVAGVDLARLSAQDVTVERDAVSVRLPQAEILHSRLDNDRSEVYERSAGLLTGPDRDLETRVRREAETRIRQAALESGVLTTAQTNARETLRRQLTLMGAREVRFL
jgi:hypothetical protein